jgi:uncharacterized protein (TIGR03084 family)
LNGPEQTGSSISLFWGVSTFKWSFKNRQLAVPDQAIRVVLSSPSGELWAWGPDDAENVVSGSALDFCLVVTQRRNRADTGLEIQGDIADQWIEIAQAFAGPPADGPAPGVRKISNQEKILPDIDDF